MIKIFCDICGREIPSIGFITDGINNVKVNISSPGKMDKELDICSECHFNLNSWITERRKER